MGFIAELRDKWEEEEIFGLKYFDSFEDYYSDFVYDFIYERLGIFQEEIFKLLDLEWPGDSYRLNKKKDVMILDYIERDPSMIEKKYFETFGEHCEDCMDLNDSVYKYLIPIAFLVYHDRGYDYEDIWNMEIPFYWINLDTKYTHVVNYLDFIEPEIFAEGKTADKISNYNKNFYRGIFYI